MQLAEEGAFAPAERSALIGLVKGQSKLLEYFTHRDEPHLRRKELRRARRRYEKSPSDETVQQRLTAAITSRRFTPVETMDVIMNVIGPGGEVPSDEESGEEGDHNAKRRHKWAWIRGSEHDVGLLVEDYNWRVLQGDADFEELWEEFVQGLEWPILPRHMESDKDAQKYNAELLMYAKGKRTDVAGGGGVSAAAARVRMFFAPVTTTTGATIGTGKAEGPGGGEPEMPVQVREDGTAFVDGVHVKAALDELRAGQQRLEAKLTRAKHAGELRQQRPQLCHNVRQYGKCAKGTRCPFYHPPPRGGEPDAGANPQ